MGALHPRLSYPVALEFKSAARKLGVGAVVVTLNFPSMGRVERREFISMSSDGGGEAEGNRGYNPASLVWSGAEGP